MKKKLLTVCLALTMCVCLVACGDKKDEGSTQNTTEKQEVELTPENVSQYLSFEANLMNGDYENVFGITNCATADMEIKAYSTATGSYDNVEVTVRPDLSADNTSLTDKWHLKDTEATETTETTEDTEATEDQDISITFKLSSSGDYNSSYPIACSGSTQELSGKRNLEVVSIKGKFIPQ